MEFNYKIGSFAGSPIYINLSTALCFLYFWSYNNFISGIVYGICFVLLMLFHELGHAWFVVRYRHRLIKINLYPVHGSCLYEHSAEREPETLLYAGGLLAQLILAIVFYALFNFLNIMGFVKLISLLQPVGEIFIQVNIVIFILNSLPIPGLDGFFLWKRLFSFLKQRSIHLYRNVYSRIFNKG